MLLTLLSGGAGVVVPPEPDEPEVLARIDDWSDVEPVLWRRPPEVVHAIAECVGITVVASVGDVTADGEANAFALPITVTVESGQPDARGAQNLPDDVLVALAMLL